jgi:hypothetical protein
VFASSEPQNVYANGSRFDRFPDTHKISRLEALTLLFRVI